MIAHPARSHYPTLAAVAGREPAAARARNHDARTILHVKTVERRDRRTSLLFPLKAAVVRRQHDSVRADGPAVSLVRREPDGADGIALRQRILPLPATRRILGVRRGDKETQQ